MATLTFASFWFSTPQSTALDASTPVKANGITTPLVLEGFEHANNRLTNVGVGRMYEINYTGSVSLVAGNEGIVACIIHKNGVALPGAWAGLEVGAKVAAYGAIACGGQTYMDTGDYVELWLTSPDGDDFQIDGGTFMVKVLG